MYTLFYLFSRILFSLLLIPIPLSLKCDTQGCFFIFQIYLYASTNYTISSHQETYTDKRIIGGLTTTGNGRYFINDNDIRLDCSK